ncbi:MAG TPA: hypothetical protein VI911_10560 [Patescibacteria group bacterium]|nr:hypothetical protein [Patescibacteria group bacterium]
MQAFQVEIQAKDEIAPIIERMVKNYKGLLPFQSDSGSGEKGEAWIRCYTIDENEFQVFLHTEFLKLIPIVEVIKDGDVNLLVWPTKHTSTALKTIEAINAMPAI